MQTGGAAIRCGDRGATRPRDGWRGAVGRRARRFARLPACAGACVAYATRLPAMQRE